MPDCSGTGPGPRPADSATGPAPGGPVAAGPLAIPAPLSATRAPLPAAPAAVVQTAPAAAIGWLVAPWAAHRTTRPACARSPAVAGSFVRRRARAAPESCETAEWPDWRGLPGAAQPSALRPLPRSSSPAPDATAAAALSPPASGCTSLQPLRAAALLLSQPRGSYASHPRFGAIRPHQVVEVAQHLHIVQRALYLFGAQSLHLRRFLRRLDRRYGRPPHQTPPGDAARAHPEPGPGSIRANSRRSKSIEPGSASHASSACHTVFWLCANSRQRAQPSRCASSAVAA